MKRNLLSFALLAGLSASVFSCSKDDTTSAPVIPPSDGDTAYVLNGIISTEAGSVAGNSVFLDFSTATQTPIARTSWDLGFYTGNDFRVIINNTTGATAKALTKTDITAVTTADTTGFKTTLQLGMGLGTFSIVDNVEGNLDSTVIAQISATEANNYVYIIRPTNGSASAEKDWYKVKITRSGSDYQLQYAKLSETTIKTITISKDANYNFKYVSFDNNAIASVEPAKAAWDLEWTYTTYKSGTIPYPFADFVYINNQAGVTAAELVYANADARNTAYTNYTDSSIASTTFSNSKTAIADKWRVASAPPGSGLVVGVRTDRFYVIKDAAGNVYKLKFISFITQDGGTRGKPKVEFKLVKKGS
ncbi:HmuY protein [Filimonas lacunae]|uniref:HmuY protein n=1 Tax=Filimonas lacunae TaxID=477680 RepID=A0A173MBZ2_9BACT|nr:HmuY family protein [Filimonas lacunae]BAV05065.1 hypothetical protein FLA_1071 [Filimonas lacunae]SIT34286.1 HmuY protein [Filimonas lacunae]